MDAIELLSLPSAVDLIDAQGFLLIKEGECVVHRGVVLRAKQANAEYECSKCFCRIPSGRCPNIDCVANKWVFLRVDQ
jgi:hypothetical protein